MLNNNYFTRPTNTSSNVNRRLIVTTLAGFFAGAFLMATFMMAGRSGWPTYPLGLYSLGGGGNAGTTPIQLEAILHYATSNIVPQQNMQEIMQSFNVLRLRAPCNFLVFGLGYDSLMWASLNPAGTTLFLEETPEWVQTVLKDAPHLNAKTVAYRTQLSQADELYRTYLEEPTCRPDKAYLKGNKMCPLALENLPEEVYAREWDVIMIDAPRGFEPQHPGRMAAIFSAAVMARGRKRAGNTHVYLHDVDRQVEKKFAAEFLCMKYKVGGAGRLWHFEIPPSNSNDAHFC